VSPDSSGPQSYKDAGVDIAAGEKAVDLIAPYAKKTFTPNVLSGIGPFGGLYHLAGYKEPVLASSTDSVGTKVLLAGMMNQHETVGIDLVNHCVNDIFTLGASPLFFLDYFATGKVHPEKVAEIVRGMATACEESGCVLIGGETAEMPGIYSEDDYDIAGFIVGAVERWALIDGQSIREGDLLIGLPSSGLHTNGYTFVRHVFDLSNNPSRLEVHESDLGRSLGEALLEPHRNYYKELRSHLPQIRGLAHITGGGIPGNLPRILPSNAQATIKRDSWEIPPLFSIIQKTGNVTDDEMFRIYNMGVGMIIATRPRDTQTILNSLDDAWLIGEISSRDENKPIVEIV
tara:strand:+ start:4974 stop:6008 length:1035 start_codon:yes stop_codon:yes gene_type:complete